VQLQFQTQGKQHMPLALCQGIFMPQLAGRADVSEVMSRFCPFCQSQTACIHACGRHWCDLPLIKRSNHCKQDLTCRVSVIRLLRPKYTMGRNPAHLDSVKRYAKTKQRIIVVSVMTSMCARFTYRSQSFSKSITWRTLCKPLSMPCLLMTSKVIASRTNMVLH